MNWMTIPAMIGPIVGPIVGGFMTELRSRGAAIFFLNMPIGLLGVRAGAVVCSRISARRRRPGSICAALLSAGLGLALLELAIENLGRPIIPGALGMAFFPPRWRSCCSIGWHARRRQDPILDLALLRIRPSASAP